MPFDGISIAYHCDHFPSDHLKLVPHQYTIGDNPPSTGSRLERGATANGPTIEILKLHGSLNFPAACSESKPKFTRVVAEPLILPPVFNKMDNATPLAKTWQLALQRLNAAKNIAIVGYSLPRTDTYMQYFLKAGIGPDRDLNRVYVFDPVLFREGQAREAMIQRYRDCFAQHMQKNIVFDPPGSETVATHREGDKVVEEREPRDGSFGHFTSILTQNYPISILF